MMADSRAAPSYPVPFREIIALEHPMIIKNIDKGLKTLGTGVPPRQLMVSEGYDGCFPLYLRPADPTCAPLLSHNTPTGNVVLKVIVPKRTGRKRKRGSEDPWISDPSLTPEATNSRKSPPSSQSLKVAGPEDSKIQAPQTPAEEETGSNRENRQSEAPPESRWKYAKTGDETGPTPGLRSHSRLDSPKDLLRTLKDNVGKYQIEAVGTIHHTHRYRGVADFHYSTFHGRFMTNFRETILTGNVQDLRNFKLDPSRGPKENEELIPPPTLSDKILPFNWGYHQNSNIKVTTNNNTGEQMLVNQSAGSKVHTFYVPFDCETVPTEPPALPPPEPMITAILSELQQLLEERPIWTRRAIMNRLSKDNPALYLLKPAIQYVAYQFRGGPWRDGIVKYGVDPRKDPKYRVYQTLFFKVVDERLSTQQPGDPWHDIRSEYTRRAQRNDTNITSHIFDGQSISLDGKIWQVCDITDPLVRKLLDTETLRTECDDRDGWFCNGTMAKVKAVMRTKITAIQLGRHVGDEDFAKTLEIPDHVKDKEWFQAKMPVLRVPEEFLPGQTAHPANGTIDFEIKHGRAWRKRRLREIKKRTRALRLLNDKDALRNTRRGRLTARKLMGQYGVTADAPSDIVSLSSGDPRVDDAMRALASIEGVELPAGDEEGMGLNVEEEEEVDEDEDEDEGEDEDDLAGEFTDEDEDDGDDERGESADEDLGAEDEVDMVGALEGEGYQVGVREGPDEGSGYRHRGHDALEEGDSDDDMADNQDVRQVL